MPSNSYDYTVNMDTMVQDCLREIGVLGDGLTMNGSQRERGYRAINLLLHSLIARPSSGLKVWTNKRATLFPQLNQAVYALGTDHATTSYVQSALTVAGIATDTTLNLASAGMTAGDYIGIRLTSGVIYWTTISTIPGGTSVTIPAPGLSGPAALGSIVYTYTTRLARPDTVLTTVVRDTNGIDHPVGLGMTLQGYESLSKKDYPGRPFDCYVEPHVSDQTLYFDTAFDDTTDLVKLVVRMPFSDMDSDTDTFDVPMAWLRAIKFNGAVEMAPQFNKVVSQELAALASASLQIAMGQYPETSTDYFQPGLD